MGLPSTLTKPLKSGTKAVVRGTKSGASAVAHGATAVAKPVAKTVVRPLKPVARTVAKPLKPVAKTVVKPLKPAAKAVAKGVGLKKDKPHVPQAAPPIFDRTTATRSSLLAANKKTSNNSAATQRQKLLTQTFAEPKIRIVKQPMDGTGKVSFVLAPAGTAADSDNHEGHIQQNGSQENGMHQDAFALSNFPLELQENALSNELKEQHQQEEVPEILALSSHHQMDQMEGSVVSFGSSDNGDLDEPSGGQQSYGGSSFGSEPKGLSPKQSSDLKSRLSRQLSDQLQQKLQQQLHLSDSKATVQSEDFKDSASVGSQQKQIISLEVDQEDLQSLKQLSKAGSLKSFTTAGGESFIIEEVLEEEEIIIIEEEVEVDEDDAFPDRDFTIRFDEFDEMYDILHLNDYSKHEIKKTWYERDDYNRMVDESRKTAEKMEAAQGTDKVLSRKYETRGLENWTEIGSTKAKLIKQAAMDAVWNEQMRQWNNSRANPEQIRVLYSRAAKASADAAKNRGYDDFLIVKKILEDDRLRKEKKEHMRRPAKLVKKSKALIGSAAKKTTRTTGHVLKKTGKGVVTGTKIGFKSTKAVATLDAKGLVKAIKNKPKKEETTEGFRSVRLSRAAGNEKHHPQSPASSTHSSPEQQQPNSDGTGTTAASTDDDNRSENSMSNDSPSPNGRASPVPDATPASPTSSISTADFAASKVETPESARPRPASDDGSHATDGSHSHATDGSRSRQTHGSEDINDEDEERKSKDKESRRSRRRSEKKARRERKENEKQQKKDEKKQKEIQKELDRKEKKEEKKEKERQKEMERKEKKLDKKYARRQKEREKKGHRPEWEMKMMQSGKC